MRITTLIQDLWTWRLWKSKRLPGWARRSRQLRGLGLGRYPRARNGVTPFRASIRTCSQHSRFFVTFHWRGVCNERLNVRSLDGGKFEALEIEPEGRNGSGMGRHPFRPRPEWVAHRPHSCETEEEMVSGFDFLRHEILLLCQSFDISTKTQTGRIGVNMMVSSERSCPTKCFNLKNLVPLSSLHPSFASV